MSGKQQSVSMSTAFAHIENMLQGIRKVAAETDPNPPTSTEIQDRKGIAEAEAAGSNVASTEANTDGEDAATSSVPGGVPASTADSAPTQIGAQPIPAEQKVARFNKLATAFVEIAEREALEVQMKEAAAQVDPAMAAMQKRADEILTGYRELICKGLQLRARDELIVKEACAQDAEIRQIVDQVGGIPAFLDKIAAEMPEAVLSEIDPSLVPPPAEMAPEMGAEMGAEMAPEMGAEGGMDIDQLAEALDAQGVTEEDLQAAAEAIEAMKAEGASDEQVVQAVQELMQEGMASAEAAPAEEAPAEAPAEEAPAEEASAEEKEASVKAARDRIEYFKSIARKK
jgi:hypothetical protein